VTVDFYPKSGEDSDALKVLGWRESIEDDDCKEMDHGVHGMKIGNPQHSEVFLIASHVFCLKRWLYLSGVEYFDG